MKGPRAAALIAGWLAVALSMAALATAAISRVGSTSPGAQVQVTITRTATVQPSPALGSSSAPQSPADTLPSVATSPATSATPTVETTQFARSASVNRVTQAMVPVATSPAQVVPVPNLGTVPQLPTPTKTPSSSPSKTPTPTPKPTPTPTPSPDGSTWHGHQGGMRAHCNGGSVTLSDRWVAKGYRMTERSSWIRTVVFFEGPHPVTVRVDCYNDHPWFSADD